MTGKGNPHLFGRVPLKYRVAVELEARRLGISPSEQVRRILREHFDRVVTIQTSGGYHLEALARLAKQYMTHVQLSRQVTKVPMQAEKTGGLPGSQKRDELEVLVWRAIQEAVAYSKTEDAAKDAEARLLALRVANGLMRTELAILKQQDDAFVDALLEELGVDTDGLAAKAQKGS